MFKVDHDDSLMFCMKYDKMFNTFMRCRLYLSYNCIRQTFVKCIIPSCFYILNSKIINLYLIVTSFVRNSSYETFNIWIILMPPQGEHESLLLLNCYKCKSQTFKQNFKDDSFILYFSLPDLNRYSKMSNFVI